MPISFCIRAFDTITTVKHSRSKSRCISKRTINRTIGATMPPLNASWRLNKKEYYKAAANEFVASLNIRLLIETIIRLSTRKSTEFFFSFSPSFLLLFFLLSLLLYLLLFLFCFFLPVFLRRKGEINDTYSINHTEYTTLHNTLLRVRTYE